MYKGVTTAELDELAAETAAHLSGEHPDYGSLAARIAVSNLHKSTSKNFAETIDRLHQFIDSKTKMPAPLIADNVAKFVSDNKDALNGAIVYDRDMVYDYFGFKTLERSYLLKLDGKIVERPQHMLMRVACGIHCGDLAATIETYNLMSLGWFTHASPTLFNAGTPRPQLSSCFLLTMKDDSIEGIYDTLKQCALISKGAGGVGLAVHNIRATGSYIRGTNGVSNGLVPMLRVYNATARYVDQGGGKRKGAFAIYLEPWHADLMAFLDLKKNTGVEEIRARDLFYGLWVPDLFMQRVEQNGEWSLFCPNEAPGLADCWGAKFDELYAKYEAEGRARQTLKAREVWTAIITTQIETGGPYMLYKDTCNRKSNQQNLGTIRCSNLCTEIVEYTAPDETAVCNLASVALPMFVHDGVFDHKELFRVVQVMTRNLNKVIDINHYPTKETQNSNMRHRPIGIGIQGLADAFVLMRYPFDSLEAQQLNKDIFETIYFAALSASKDLAKIHGPYSTYAGSPISQGFLHFDDYSSTTANASCSSRKDCSSSHPEQQNQTKQTNKPNVQSAQNWDWATLRQEIKQHGVRNSLLIAPMPTASTSQILGNNECFEPYTSNLYVRRTLAGEFVCVSRHLLADLIRLGLWNPRLKNKLVANNGSVQSIAEVPQDIKNLYKTVWEISQKTIVNMAADRAAFIDQSQSLNIHMSPVSFEKVSSMHFHGWRLGLKTGMYYLRTKPAVDAIKFTVDQEMLRQDLSISLPSSSGSVASTTAKAQAKPVEQKSEPSPTNSIGNLDSPRSSIASSSPVSFSRETSLSDSTSLLSSSGLTTIALEHKISLVDGSTNNDNEEDFIVHRPVATSSSAMTTDKITDKNVPKDAMLCNRDDDGCLSCSG